LAGNDCYYYIEMLSFLQEVDPYSTTLLEVTVQVTTDSECSSTYVDYGRITDRMICAGDSNGGTGACGVKAS
jgi:hypothetical protein